jgi:hypothetical protein
MLQTTLAALVDGQGTPYYGGAIDGLRGPVRASEA